MPEISKIERKGVTYDIKDRVARNLVVQKYSKPDSGIPRDDLSEDVNRLLDSAGQPVPDKVSELENDAGYTSNIGTITGVQMNGVNYGTSGIVDLGSVITSHQDLSGKQDVLVSGTSIKSINGQSVLGSGDIDTLDARVDEDNETLIFY